MLFSLVSLISRIVLKLGNGFFFLIFQQFSLSFSFEKANYDYKHHAMRFLIFLVKVIYKLGPISLKSINTLQMKNDRFSQRITKIIA